MTLEHINWEVAIRMTVNPDVTFQVHILSHVCGAIIPVQESN
jgi:hypothetical protein